MLEQTAKSSRLFAEIQKLHVDFQAKSSMAWGMANDDEIDPIRVRSGLFGLITARFEDTHELAVKGQSEKANAELIGSYVGDIRLSLDEIQILLSAIHCIEVINSSKEL